MESYTYEEAVLFRWYFSSASVKDNTYQVICFRDEETKTDVYKLLSRCKLTNASSDVLKRWSIAIIYIWKQFTDWQSIAILTVFYDSRDILSSLIWRSYIINLLYYIPLYKNK